MRVLFLIEGWISPGPRYRVLQYLSFLRENGVQCEVRALHGKRNPQIMYWPLMRSIYKFLVRSKRLFQIRDAGEFDVVYLQRLTLPFSSFIEERLASKNSAIVFDFDDPLFQNVQNPNQGTRSKVFGKVVRLSRHIVAGSTYLAEAAGCLEKTTVIPTIVDTDIYKPGPSRSNETLVIGWIGSYSNLYNFEPIVDAIKDVLNRSQNVMFKVVCDQPPPFELPRMVYVPWTEKGEIPDIQSFDIGLMPLLDTQWNKGKCAFKLIQYMAMGLPVVASSVGVNKEVVEQGKSGFLVDSLDQWQEALVRLVESAELRSRLGARGREICVGRYSLQSQKSHFLQVIRAAANE